MQEVIAYSPAGSHAVKVIHPAPNAQRPGETGSQFLDRVRDRAIPEGGDFRGYFVKADLPQANNLKWDGTQIVADTAADLSEAKGAANAQIIQEAEAALTALAPLGPAQLVMQTAKAAELDRYKDNVIDGGQAYDPGVYPFIAGDVGAFGGSDRQAFDRMEAARSQYLAASAAVEAQKNKALAGVAVATDVAGVMAAATVDWSLS